jgi:segregation and condensation protein A
MSWSEGTGRDNYACHVPYDVTTPVFNGPFDLLLHLVTKDQVDIYELSISTIVEGYVAELAKLPVLDLENATEFLLVAAILVELKTRRLLPGPDDVDIDEEVAFWEERDMLIARLLECKVFKDAAALFGDMLESAALSRPRRSGLEEQFLGLTPDPLSGTTPQRLRDALLRSLRPKVVPRVDLFHVTPVKITVSEVVHRLVTELPTMYPRGVDFRTIAAHCTERAEVLVHFLAVLELFKQGWVDLDQPRTFGSLRIQWIGDTDNVNESTNLDDLVDTYEG